MNRIKSRDLFASILLVSLSPKKERLFMAKAMCFLPAAIFFLDRYVEEFLKDGFDMWLFYQKDFCLFFGLLFVGLWVWSESTFVQKDVYS